MEQERSNINTGLRAVLEGSSSRTTTREELTTATTIMKQQQEDRRTRPTQLDGRQNHPHVQSNPQAPPHQPQKCPRCDSMNTKFCYYNNYSLSQPRYFCKTCRRYWTHGGTLRNVPVGGGCRKAKRSKPSSSAATDAPRPKELLSAGGGNLVSPLAPTAAGEGPLSYSFFGVGGGFLSSLAAAQSLTQTPPAPPPFVGASGGCATSLGFFQGFGSSVLPSTPFGSHQSQQIHQIQPAQMFHQVVHPSLSSDHQERTSVSQGKPTIITSSAAAAAQHHGEWSFMMSNAGNSNENPSAQGLWSASGDRNGVGAGVGSSPPPPPPLSLNQTQLHDHHHHLPGFGPPQ